LTAPRALPPASPPLRCGARAPADVQLTWILTLGFAGDAATADHLVVDFDDGMRLIPRFVANGWLRQAEVDRLVAVERLLAGMSEQGNGHLWTTEALHTAAEWEAVRVAALEALLTI